MFGSWKARISVAEKRTVSYYIRPKCIAVYGEVQEYCLPPGEIQ